MCVRLFGRALRAVFEAVKDVADRAVGPFVESKVFALALPELVEHPVPPGAHALPVGRIDILFTHDDAVDLKVFTPAAEIILQRLHQFFGVGRLLRSGGDQDLVGFPPEPLSGLKLLHGGLKRLADGPVQELRCIHPGQHFFPVLIHTLDLEHIVKAIDGVFQGGVHIQTHHAVGHGPGRAPARAHQQQRGRGSSGGPAHPAGRAAPALMHLHDLTKGVARVAKLDNAPVVAQRSGLSIAQIHDHSLHEASPSFTNFRYPASCG